MSVNNYLSTEEIKNVWEQTCGELKTQLSPAVYNTWILQNPLTSVSVDQNNNARGVITCSTAFHATNIKKNLYSQLKITIEKYLQKKIELSFQVGNPLEKSLAEIDKTKIKKAKNGGFFEAENKSPTVDELFSARNIMVSAKDRAFAKAKTIGLRLDYTFKTFAVSTSNEMAHAAASAVSNNPGATYNPLFLYGGVGVGKTHLMHAVAHNILANNPDIKIIYCTGEEFTNEIVSAIQTKKAIEFKKKFRNANVLLIDDIQFIAGKNAVQQEFFHTFNTLIKQSAQIILTSDRPPHEINLLEDRLKSRFEAGLMIDIQQPSFELRTAILLIKAQANNLELNMELAQTIATKVESARKIEGIINQIRSEVELRHKEIDQEMINRILLLESNKKQSVINAKPQDIIKIVADYFKVKQTAIKGKRRTKELVLARHIAMYFLKNELRMSLEEIGRWFSNRDHTSVIHAIKKIEKEIVLDGEIKKTISALKTSLYTVY